ncbi:MAG: hypothetical protein AAF573_07785 [Bacteroidota bacterium]
MKHLIKIIAVLCVAVLIINLNPNEENLNTEGVKNSLSPTAGTPTKTGIRLEKPRDDDANDDTRFRWDEKLMDWVTVPSEEEAPKLNPKPSLITLTADSKKPIEINWEILLDIDYELKYFPEVEMEIYAPVFPDELKALDGKEVIIEGFVIPFDESGDLLALSANPYAACFFCGKASPASVLSLYPKKKKRYKIDDFRKFRGLLQLNYDDPEEYYYILRKAVSIK